MTTAPDVTAVQAQLFCSGSVTVTTEDHVASVSPAAAPCPKCGARGNMGWQWKPDLEPTRERLRCYRCGWDSDWIRYGTLGVREATL